LTHKKNPPFSILLFLPVARAYVPLSLFPPLLSFWEVFFMFLPALLVSTDHILFSPRWFPLFYLTPLFLSTHPVFFQLSGNVKLPVSPAFFPWSNPLAALFLSRLQPPNDRSPPQWTDLSTCFYRFCKKPLLISASFQFWQLLSVPLVATPSIFVFLSFVYCFFVVSPL